MLGYLEATFISTDLASTTSAPASPPATPSAAGGAEADGAPASASSGGQVIDDTGSASSPASPSAGGETATGGPPAPVPAQVPASHDGDMESSFVSFGDFPGVPVAPTGVADGGEDVPPSTSPAAAAAPTFSNTKMRLTKNQKRAAARKKAYEARAAAGDGEASEAPAAPAAPAASPTPNKFRRVSRNRSRRRIGVSGRKRVCFRGRRRTGFRGKCVRRRLKRRGRGGAVVRKKRGDDIWCGQAFTFGVTEENYRSFCDQIRGGGAPRGGKKHQLNERAVGRNVVSSN